MIPTCMQYPSNATSYESAPIEPFECEGEPLQNCVLLSEQVSSSSSDSELDTEGDLNGVEVMSDSDGSIGDASIVNTRENPFLEGEQSSQLCFETETLAEIHNYPEDLVNVNEVHIEKPNERQEDAASIRKHIHIVSVHICLFLSFFQLCYKVSERGISLLLAFITSLLSWLGTFPQSAHILQLRDLISKNVYFLRKIFGLNSALTMYAVCPKCSSLYELKDCTVKHRNGLEESAKYTYVQYPNHPHISRREKCNTILLKQVKCGSSYKLRPRKVYVYNSVRSSLKKLFSRPGFSEKCELWRSKFHSPDIYTDIYDGLVWNRFQNVSGWPFLELPNSLGLILNVDWFNPYKHIQYSVGMIYLVIGNLPRSERYKLENVIIVGVIPRPNEPKKHMNTFLEPLVNELLELWDGSYLNTSSIFGIVPVRCALICVSCDLPATRKACGFTS